jgi:RNA polymerase sigma factor (sigma-70 family)
MKTAAQLVEAAAHGDEDAWYALVDRYNGLLWSVARSHRLGMADAADVVQTAWLRLVERLSSLRDPERVGAWLATTTRRECLRTQRRAGRQVPTDDERRLDEPVPVRRGLDHDQDQYRDEQKRGHQDQNLKRQHLGASLKILLYPHYDQISRQRPIPATSATRTGRTARPFPTPHVPPSGRPSMMSSVVNACPLLQIIQTRHPIL